MPEIAGGFGAPTLAEATRRRNLQARRQGGRLRQRPLLRRAPAGRGQADLHQRRLLPDDPDLAMPRAPAETRRPSSALLAVTALAGAAAAALVEVDNLVLRADGGFQPQTLPRRQFAPIDFNGRLDIAAKDGGRPSPLRQALIDFDRDGRLERRRAADLRAGIDRRRRAPRKRGRSAAGRWSATAASKRRSRCRRRTVRASSPLTIFNGPRPSGLPDRGPPRPPRRPRDGQTYAIAVPIEQRPRRLPLPRHARRPADRRRPRRDDPRRRRRSAAATGPAARHRSYVSARCSDSILQTHGRFTFADGTVIDGSVEKFCHAK